MTPEQVAGKKFYYGKGCEKCNNTGYKGRMGIYELLVMNEQLREMVVSEASLDAFRDACRKYGMRTLRESGLEAIHTGQTSIEEIIRETMLDDADPESAPPNNLPYDDPRCPSRTCRSARGCRPFNTKRWTTPGAR